MNETLDETAGKTTPSPTSDIHPIVIKEIDRCDRLYIESFGIDNKHLKVCKKLICMGHPMTPEKLTDLCNVYCRRWTYPL